MIKKQRSKDEILKKRSKRKSGNILPLILGIFILAGFIILTAGVLIAVGGYMYFTQDLPKISSLKDYNPPRLPLFIQMITEKSRSFFMNEELSFLFPICRIC